MDRMESQDTVANEAGASPEAAAPTGRTRRSLEWAAVRDLKRRKRADYRKQDAEDAQHIDHLRHERNQQVDALDQQAWDARSSFELLVAEQRVPWIDAHDEAVVAKRAARKALAASRKEHNAADRAAIEKLRVAHRAAQEEFDAEARSITLAHELALCDLRTEWNETRGRTDDAKRTMKAELRELRRTNATERPERVAAETHARQERTAASEARWDAARKANLAYAASVVELRDAERSHASAERLEALRATRSDLRQKAERLEAEARSHDLATADAVFDERREASSAAIFTKARIRDAWLSGRHEGKIQKSKARKAMNSYRSSNHGSEEAARADLRARRNAEGDAYNNAVQAVYATRGIREAALRDDYLEKRDQERRIRKEAKAAARQSAREQRAAHREELERIRKQKVAAQESFSQDVETINRARGVERAEERAAVRSIADDILAAYEAARDEREAQRAARLAAQKPSNC